MQPKCPYLLVVDLGDVNKGPSGQRMLMLSV